MLKYSVCISAVFHGIAPETAMERAAAAGAKAYEFWGWDGLDLDAVEAAQKRCGLQLAAMCTRAFHLTDPDRRQAYLDGLRASLPVAARLGCSTLITQVGPELSHLPRDRQHQSIVDGLKACVPLLEAAGVTLVIEPLNTLVNHPGYYLVRSDEAFAIVREVNSPYVKVLFDLYHQQVSEGNLIANLTANADWIGHIHIAGCPGRHEPFGENEICYPAVLSALGKAGYSGFVGLEYFPLLPPEDGLRRILQQRALES